MISAIIGHYYITITMHFLFTDETNTVAKDEAGIRFLAYGGLIIPCEGMVALDKGISQIRSDLGLKPTESLKFDTNSRPKRISNENFSEAKNRVIDLCIQLQCKFLVYVVLHRIAKTQGLGETVKWGADHIVGKFNHYLTKCNSSGFVVVDRFLDDREYSFLTEKFTSGLLIGDKSIPLGNIKMFASSCNNASHFSSAMDIVLGSFRYCINQPNIIPARKMMKNIVTLLWGDVINGNLDPFEKGLTLRPKDIKNPAYKSEYDSLIERINELLA